MDLRVGQTKGGPCAYAYGAVPQCLCSLYIVCVRGRGPSLRGGDVMIISDVLLFFLFQMVGQVTIKSLRSLVL
jgi:hypothetical protein